MYNAGWWIHLLPHEALDRTRNFTDAQTSVEWHTKGRRLQFRDRDAGDSIQSATVLLRWYGAKTYVCMHFRIVNECVLFKLMEESRSKRLLCRAICKASFDYLLTNCKAAIVSYCQRCHELLPTITVRLFETLMEWQVCFRSTAHLSWYWKKELINRNY